VEVTDAPALLARVAQELWTDQSTKLVVQRLKQVDALAERPHLLALAAATPVDEVRFALAETLRRNWQDGPQGLRTSGLPIALISEPGFLVTLKTLLKEDAVGRNGRPARTRMPAGRPTYGSGTSRSANMEEPERVWREWATFLKELYQATADRCQAGAQVQAGASGSDGPRFLETRVLTPIRLHDGAHVVNGYELRWPTNLPAEASGAVISPLLVQYARIVEKARLKDRLAYYRRQLDVPERLLDDHRVWLELTKTDPQSGVKTSCDVFLVTAEESPYTDAEQEERIVIDILVVKMRESASSALRRPLGADRQVGYSDNPPSKASADPSPG
jgi:hypothetical protein